MMAVDVMQHVPIALVPQPIVQHSLVKDAALARDVPERQLRHGDIVK